MFCYKCGKQIPDESQFCTYCGAPQTQQASKPQPSFKEPDPVSVKPVSKEDSLLSFIEKLEVLYGKRIAVGKYALSVLDIVTIAAAFLSIISIFMPVYEISAFGYKEGYSLVQISSKAGSGQGAIALIIILSAACIASVFLPEKWNWIMSAASLILFILYGVLSSEVNGYEADYFIATGRKGAGMYCLAIGAIFLLAAGVLIFIKWLQDRIDQIK